MSNELIDDLRLNADAHPLDVRLSVMSEAANALESQAREIERLGKYKRFESAYHEAERELAALKAQAEKDPWKASGADWCSSIHRNPDAKAWADFFVAVFPGLADKHELMIGWFANAMMAMHDHLKAQPSGVVLPERQMYTAYLSGVVPSNAVEVNSYRDGWNACLDEVARLNSSPASAGEPLPHWEPCNPGCDPDFNGQRSRECAQLCRPAREALSASAGDERASRVNDWFLSLPPARQAVLRDDKWLLADAAFIAGQARAALSANHSEQVRQMVPQMVDFSPVPDDFRSQANGYRAGWNDCRAALSAPSAGSQGGDV